MITEKVKKALLGFGIPQTARHITVALSGGADSVVLLDVLCRLRNELGITVSAAHLNHMIRGAEADGDEQFVKELCDKYGIELTVGREDIPSIARKTGQSTELAARNARYAFLERVAPAGVIATAHTASDQLETMLLNLTRGTGPDGLCGIPPIRGRIIRPLLACSRAEIERYCDVNGLSFVTDSTNLSDDYTRNRIRHLVIPQLKNINPEVEAAACRCAEFMREDREFLNKTAAAKLSGAVCENTLKLEDLTDLEPSVLKRVLRGYAADIPIEVDAFHTECLVRICREGGKCSMPGGYTAVSNGKTLRISRENEPETHFQTDFTEETVDFSKDTEKIHNLLLNNALDCDKIVGKLELRHRMPGDKLRVRGRNGTKTLKKLYNEYSIPLCERKNLPIACDERGIVWIYRIGVAARCAVSRDTKRIVRFSVVKQDV